MKKKKGHLGLSNSFHYTLMVLPGYIWLFMFSIVPMVGIVMAFQDYNPSKGWFGSPWVGMKWFKYLTVIPDAKRALVNTLIIAIANLDAMIFMMVTNGTASDSRIGSISSDVDR